MEVMSNEYGDMSQLPPSLDGGGKYEISKYAIPHLKMEAIETCHRTHYSLLLNGTPYLLCLIFLKKNDTYDNTSFSMSIFR
jgi:hypothetical protein